MHTGISGLMRKMSIGRWLLFHINTGLFWIYGSLTFILVMLVSGFWLGDRIVQIFLSLTLALIMAFTSPQLVYGLLWRWFHNVWIANYVIGLFWVAILLALYAWDVRNGRDALRWLAIRMGFIVVLALISYRSSRKRSA
jgi:hypothetical protein